MSDLPTARNKSTSYENFLAECPLCGSENVFNRASDLGTFAPIAGREVSCLNAECGEPFYICGDTVNSAHEMLIYDCSELIERKHYMACILNLTQAYEVFFSLFLRIELLYRPFAADRRLAELNKLSEELSEKLERHTFAPLRSLFLHHIVTGWSPKNLTEAALAIRKLPAKPGDPGDVDIASLSDPKLVQLLKLLKSTEIHRLRNRIVHKDAYRPNREEAQAALEKTRALLFPLTDYFKVRNEINSYLNGL